MPQLQTPITLQKKPPSTPRSLSQRAARGAVSCCLPTCDPYALGQIDDFKKALGIPNEQTCKPLFLRLGELTALPPHRPPHSPPDSRWALIRAWVCVTAY